MIFEYSLSASRADFYNITPQIREAVSKSGVTSGIAVVYCPHTTAGITINENADPDVRAERHQSIEELIRDWSKQRL